MKCENCGKNEVTFIYHGNINGHVTEKHLCSACARQLGYLKQPALQIRSMQRELFGTGLLGGGFFDEFFAPRMALAEDPFASFFGQFPSLAEMPKQAEEESESLVEEKEQSRFSRMRQLNALRAEMKKAVRKEEFERAAQLRDEIRALEDPRENA